MHTLDFEESKMSLKKVGSNIKSGFGQLTSTSGIKGALMNVGVGFAIGALTALVVRAIFVYLLNPILGTNNKINTGFSIYPNQTEQVIYFEDLVLIGSTVALLLTKRFWLVIGHFAGWYSSNYLGLWTALGLPQTTPPQ